MFTTDVDCGPHGLINYTKTKAKHHHINYLPFKDFAAGFYLSEAPSSPRFQFGVVSDFVGSESGQIQSVKTPAKYVPQHTVTPYLSYPPYTFYTYVHYTYSHREGG
jgi:hypothetical protein